MSPSPAKKLRESQTTGLARFVPIVRWLSGYDAASALRDVRAGVLVAVLLIPQAMAYALLADLSPKVGLWAAMVPPLVYALFGTSRYLAIGPVALVSLLVGQAIASTTETTGASPHEVALVLALLVGVSLLILGVLRLGFLVDFLSTPVLHGFAAAAALLIAFSQVKHLLGIDMARSPSFSETVARLFQRLDQVHWPTLWLGGGAMLLLILARGPIQRLLERSGVPGSIGRWAARFVPLLVVALGILAVWRMELPGVRVVGEADAGWPPVGFAWPGIRMLETLAPSALVIALVTFVTAMAIARSLRQEGSREIDPNQELLALGATQVAASWTGGYSVGGSFSRSAVAFDSGARTPLHALVTAGLVSLAAIYAGPFLQYLPKTILAALIMVAVTGLIDLSAIRQTWRYSRGEGIAMVVTFLAVLFLGVETGLVLGASAGVGLYLWRTSRPRVITVGRVRDSEQFRGPDHTGVAKLQKSPVLVLRVDQDLFFANARSFRECVLREVTHQGDGAVCLLLDFSSVDNIDSSALEVFGELITELRETGMELGLAEVRQPVMDRLKTVDFLDRLGSDRVYESTHEGLQTLESEYGE